jgi:hypothetical protein
MGDESYRDGLGSGVFWVVDGKKRRTVLGLGEILGLP